MAATGLTMAIIAAKYATPVITAKMVSTGITAVAVKGAAVKVLSATALTFAAIGVILTGVAVVAPLKEEEKEEF